MHDRDRIAKHKPIGPDAPPRPSSVDEVQGEPMAVANDKATRHGESFLPTTADGDQWAPEVARAYKQIPGGEVGKGITESREENRAQEDPEGYSAPDKRGWKHPEEPEP